MFGSDVLEVAIGVTLLFLLISLICTGVQEGAEAFLKTRAMDLERGIRELLHDRNGAGLAKDFYNHPLIFSLFSGQYEPDKLVGEDADRRMPRAARSSLPSYIPAKNFADAILDIAAHGPPAGAGAVPYAGGPLSVDGLRETIGKIPNESVQRAVLAALDSAGGDLAAARSNLESWYNGTMDRVSGGYKRRTQKFLLCFGLAVALVLNIDVITVARKLSEDRSLRQTIVAQAQDFARPGEAGRMPVMDYDAAKKNLAEIGFPIGWAPRPQRCLDYRRTPDCSLGRVLATDFFTVIGWLITAFAVMLGAPFWFDVLNKFMVIRSTVKPHEKSPEESSEDRQTSSEPKRTQASPPPPSGAAADEAAEAAATANAASAATALALAGGAFEPHEWRQGDAQAGVL